MSGALVQNVLVGLIVLGAVAFLVRRQIRRRAKPSALCGECPGCAPVPMPKSARGEGLVKIEGIGTPER